MVIGAIVADRVASEAAEMQEDARRTRLRGSKPLGAEDKAAIEEGNKLGARAEARIADLAQKDEQELRDSIGGVSDPDSITWAEFNAAMRIKRAIEKSDKEKIDSRTPLDQKYASLTSKLSKVIKGRRAGGGSKPRSDAGMKARGGQTPSVKIVKR